MKITKSSLAQRVITLIEQARQKVSTAVNVAQVYTNYEIGRMIVEEEQGGKTRADYGKKILVDLSIRLTAHFGRGYSVDNLERMRMFFLIYSPVQISASALRKSGRGQKSASGLRKSRSNDLENAVCPVPRFALSWSHYLVLMRIADAEKREFYEKAAVEGMWKLEQLSRQIETSYYERIVASKDKDRARKLLAKAPRQSAAEEPMKDPYVLEFLGLPDRPEYSESVLEQRIIDHIEEFMLELGKGFTFVGRQSHSMTRHLIAKGVGYLRSGAIPEGGICWASAFPNVTVNDDCKRQMRLLDRRREGILAATRKILRHKLAVRYFFGRPYSYYGYLLKMMRPGHGNAPQVILIPYSDL